MKPVGGVTFLPALLLLLLLGLDSPGAAKERGKKSQHRRSNNKGLRHPANITTVTGVGVNLACRVRVHDCGNFFSIVWYRSLAQEEQQRVYVYRHHSGVAKAEGSWAGRASHQYHTGHFLMEVTLLPIVLEDQATYRCEVTYEDQAGRWFKDSCLAAQYTHLTVHGKPDYVKVSLENSTEVTDGSSVGPYVEGQMVVLRCESSGGRPVPEVSWWNGTQQILHSWDQRVEHENGTGVARSEVNFYLSRYDIDREIVCKVTSKAVTSVLVSRLRLDLSVSPLDLVMSPETNHIEEGGRVTVTCNATQAKPPALVYWNSDPKLELEETKVEVSTGNTFTTVSKVSFEAIRELTSLSCFATNKVMDDKKQPHLSMATTVNVHYRPEILNTQLSLQYVVLGDDILLHCNYRANPMVSALTHWFRNGEPLNYKSLSVVNTTQDGAKVTIKNAQRAATGMYSCMVANKIGKSRMVDIASVHVEDVPLVRLSISPLQPVSEALQEDVTLHCQSTQPDDSLLSVKWFLDGILLRQLPDCSNGTEGEHCNMDPSSIILEEVRRIFHGNYSCQGRNRAGWGVVSNTVELLVFYPPVTAPAKDWPVLKVRKGGNLTVPCPMAHPGYPRAAEFIWLRDGVRMKGETGPGIHLVGAGVKEDRNFTCIPYNKVGKGDGASVSVRVTVPPTMDRPLKPRTGAPVTSAQVELRCSVECAPLCSISWYRNSSLLPNSSSYLVTQKARLPDYTTNRLSRIESTLLLNISAWEGGLVPSRDTANYTCASSATEEGPGVNSSTVFRVHFPPSHITISPAIQTIKEKQRPRSFHCSAQAFPLPSYFWQFENGTRTQKVQELEFPSAIRRTDGGTYTCTAYNSLGNVKAETQLQVVYKPDCTITKEVKDNVLYLKCEVDAFPLNDVTYYWYHNEDLISSAIFSAATQFEVTEGMEGEFSCQARNLAGLGPKCDVKINGPAAALVAETDFSFLIFGGGVVIILFVVIVVTTILCSRKVGGGKYDITVIHEIKQDKGVSPLSAPCRRLVTSTGGTKSATSPKVLTARKRTKNGVVKAPTELWLV